MLKFILLILSFNLWATDDHATLSLTRFENKIALTINHEKGWHTYWKNPGDAGLPSQFHFYHNGKNIELRAYEWPAPKKYMEAGNILTIGYEGVTHFFFDDPKKDIDAKINILICKDICIPGEAKLSLKATESVVMSRPGENFKEDVLKKSFSELPSPSVIPASFEYYLTRKKGEETLTLHYSIKGLNSSTLSHELLLLTSFPTPPFGFKRETLYFDDNTLYGKTEIEWDGQYQDPPLPLPENGAFPKPYEVGFLFNSPLSQKIEIINLKLSNFSNSTTALDDFYKKLTPVGEQKKNTSQDKVNDNDNIFKFLFFAFIGGLILNLMPCVLPVISIKLFGLIKHKNTPREKLIKHNISYTLGILSTLATLAGIIIGLKYTGQVVGWGFQLQSPTFILIMMIILFVLSLNLFGLFEFQTPFGNKLGNTKVTEESFIGDFLSGVLTTILSTPCSAPFLGTALTFAFTTSNFNIFIMFMMIGFGLAFPFLVTALFPASLNFFPRPGAWMEKLKYFLGLSLILTTIWLYDVFISLVNFDEINWRLNLLFTLWFFAFFFAKKISTNRVFQFILFALPFAMTTMAIQGLSLRTDAEQQVSMNQEWSSWGPEKLNELKDKNVFIDFTAEWCLTCKVNKKLVLETDAFKKLSQKHDLVLLRADWTKRDETITKFLQEHHSAGVPAYFIQKANGELKFLGETISISKIEENLN